MTKNQVQWKEYFHALYELLVFEVEDDTVNWIMINAIIGCSVFLPASPTKPRAHHVLSQVPRRPPRTFNASRREGLYRVEHSETLRGPEKGTVPRRRKHG